MINEPTFPTSVMNLLASSPTVTTPTIQFPVYWKDMSMTWEEATMTWAEVTDITRVTNLQI
jgi:hypothetical protein